MLLDHKGNPIPAKAPRWKRGWDRFRSWGKKGPTIVALLVAITAVLVNLDGAINLYERLSDGPETPISVLVENETDSPVEISNLLDIYITRSQFHSGRLMAGESPTARLTLNEAVQFGSGSAYVIRPEESRHFNATLLQRPYSDLLDSGGATIVFVLRVRGSSILRRIEMPFQKDLMGFVPLDYTISHEAR